MDKARQVALKILYKIEKENAYSNIALNEEIKKNIEKLNNQDIGLISELVYGVTTWKLTIDEIIKKYSSIKIKKISDWIINILRMGVYQIIFLDKIPKSAAVNESVNLAKRYGHKASSNFVNAILRKIEKTDYLELYKIENEIEKISKVSSMPEWIIKKLLKEKNIKEVEEICMCSNIKPNISIRINKLKTTKNIVEKELEKANIKFEDGLLEDYILINKMKNIENMESFKNGLFTIQDNVAGLPSLILNPQENENILDACSAPGGKTTYIAELMKNKGNIEAWDIYKHRIELVEQHSSRLGINIIKTKINDATKFNEKYVNKYNKILLDVPCLGIGVLKRKPDIKWKRKESDIEEITNTQMKILKNCSKYLKKEGILVYSTCSIFKEENEDIINEFLEKNKEFSIEKIKLNEKNILNKYIEKEGYMKIYQNKNIDGFFICKMKRN